MLQKYASASKQKDVHEQIENLCKEYHVKKTNTIFKAAQDINLEFPANQIIALLGPSGSGKTTLLRIIAGLEQATSGRIFFGGKLRDVQRRHCTPIFVRMTNTSSQHV